MQQATSLPGTRESKEKRIKRRRTYNSRGGLPGETLSGYLFLAPYLFVLIIFFIFAALVGFIFSLFKLDIGFSTPVFIGFNNYIAIWNQLGFVNGFENGDFWISLGNIIRFVIVVVTGQTILALILALLLQRITFLQGVFRTTLFLPTVTSSIAISIIFLWLYQPQGLVNYILSLIHIVGPEWLQDPNTALPAIMLLNIWTTAPTYMIFYLGGLQSIPRTLYEAAATDGADRFQTFWNVTLPLLRPITFLIVATGTIGTFQLFDQVFIMTQGGPLKSTLSPVYVMYNTAFNQHKFGLACAMSVLLFVLVLIVTVLQRRFIDVDVQY
ncbi:MAG: sugar ABC transporter permease [Ktedonobacteraceae bacterium]|nr:sugar ABC transporter permease [Ktedonobacteraceae bacterium]